jgi:hypothetical protein
LFILPSSVSRSPCHGHQTTVHRRGGWEGTFMIPAFHCVLDQGISDGHDDPQNFDLFQWAGSVEKIVADVRAPVSPAAPVTPFAVAPAPSMRASGLAAAAPKAAAAPAPALQPKLRRCGPTLPTASAKSKSSESKAPPHCFSRQSSRSTPTVPRAPTLRTTIPRHSTWSRTRPPAQKIHPGEEEERQGRKGPASRVLCI